MKIEHSFVIETHHALAHLWVRQSNFVCYIFNQLPTPTHSNEYKKMCLCNIPNLTHIQTFLHHETSPP